MVLTPENRNPYDPAEKNILLDKYQDGTITMVEAESLREMLNEDLELARDDAAGALAVGVLLVGISTLIGSAPYFSSGKSRISRSI